MTGPLFKVRKQYGDSDEDHAQRQAVFSFVVALVGWCWFLATGAAALSAWVISGSVGYALIPASVGLGVAFLVVLGVAIFFASE